MSARNLIIVGGCGSSGTTLLVNLLSRHPSIAAGPEMSVFNHPEIFDHERLQREWARWFRRGLPSAGYQQFYRVIGARGYYGIESTDVERWARESATTAEFLERIAAHVCEREGKEIFAEKTPTNVYSFRTIAETVPDLRLVHVIRDGRDVVCSLRNRGYTLFRAASRWLYDTLAGLRARGCASYSEIRYEELVREPVRALEPLFASVGQVLDSALLAKAVRERGSVHASYSSALAPKFWRQTPADPVSDSSVGRYRSELDRDDLAFILHVRLRPRARRELGAPVSSFGELLSLLGYDPEQDLENGHSVRRKPLVEWQDQCRRARAAFRHLRWLPRRSTYVAAEDP